MVVIGPVIFASLNWETTLAIIGMDHIQLAMPVGQEDIARSFYEGLLGLREVAKPQHLAARGGCWFETNGVRNHLGLRTIFAGKEGRSGPRL
jgi:hypothetical protein